MKPHHESTAARLELIAALRTSTGSQLKREDWVNLLRWFQPRVRRVVILHGLLGLPFRVVGERLGTTRARADQLWRRALPKLKELLPDLQDAQKPERNKVGYIATNTTNQAGAIYADE